jgi:hypothetical protein
MQKRAQVIPNPLSVGLQIGTAGAAAGLGYAAIHRAIRLHRNNEDPVSVVKPMLIGAFIGSVAGVGLGMNRMRTPQIPNRYNGIKQALFDSYADWSERHPLASTGSYFIPGVGAAMSGADALHSLSKGNYLSAAGSALMMVPGALGLGGIAKAIPRMARAARGIKPAHQPGRWGQVWQGAGQRMFGDSLGKMAPDKALRIGKAGARFERHLGWGGKKFMGLGRYGWTNVAGIGLGTAGGMQEAKQEGSTPYQGLSDYYAAN